MIVSSVLELSCKMLCKQIMDSLRFLARVRYQPLSYQSYTCSRMIDGVTGLVILVLWQMITSLSVMAAEPIVLSLSRTPLSLPFYVAQHEGFFYDEGIEVKVNEVIGGHRSMQQLLDGEADLATSTETVLMFNSFKRNDFAVIASFVSTTDDVKVIAHGTSGITRPEQLAYKRVGTILKSASHYYLDTLTLLNGIDPKSVQLVSLQPEDMASALERKEVDAIAVWQPFAYRAEREVSGAKMLPDDGFYNLSFNLSASRQIIEQRSDDLVKLLRALDRATRFISTEPLKAQTILRSRLKLDQAYVDWIWPRYQYQLTLGKSLLVSLESEARWAIEEGHITALRSPNYLSFIHSLPLRRILPAAVGIVE